MKSRLKQLLISWAIHAFTICAAILLYTSVMYLYRINSGAHYYDIKGSPVTLWQYLSNHIADLALVIWFTFLVEINYQYVFRKFRWLLFIISSLMTGIISFIPLTFLNQEQISLQGIVSVIEPVLFMAMYAFIYSLIRDYHYQSQHKKDLLLQNFENELYTLKAQLTPHFLFNSLNYLYGTALKEEAHITADGVDRLSEMLRYTITGMNEDYVLITKELDFIEQYISLQKVRVSNIDIQTDICMQPDLQNLLIPPLLLLPFIENAFKYGISIDNPNPIKIKIRVEKQALDMEIYNSIVQQHAEMKGNNTGIKNTLKRLDLLYPDNYRLECKNTGTNYKVSFHLPLK